MARYKWNGYITLVGKYARYRADGPERVAYGDQDRTVVTLEANLQF